MFFISLIFPAQSKATFNEPNRTDQSERRKTFILVAHEVDEPEQTKNAETCSFRPGCTFFQHLCLEQMPECCAEGNQCLSLENSRKYPAWCRELAFAVNHHSSSLSMMFACALTCSHLWDHDWLTSANRWNVFVHRLPGRNSRWWLSHLINYWPIKKKKRPVRWWKGWLLGPPLHVLPVACYNVLADHMSQFAFQVGKCAALEHISRGTKRRFSCGRHPPTHFSFFCSYPTLHADSSSLPFPFLNCCPLLPHRKPDVDSPLHSSFQIDISQSLISRGGDLVHSITETDYKKALDPCERTEEETE